MANNDPAEYANELRRANQTVDDTNTMSRKKIAVIQPIMIPGGGTEAVTAWTIEALKNDWDVTLITFSDIDASTLNQYYGTEFTGNDFAIARPRQLPLLSRTNRFLMLKDHLMMRYCKSVRDKFDLFIGAGGSPMDFGNRGMQFIHLGPDSTVVKVLQKDERLSSWYWMGKSAFTRLCENISGWTDEALERNLSMPNSEHTAEVAVQTYGIKKYQVMYPPVGKPNTPTPWAERENGFLCIARIVPPKRIHEVIEIIRRVRESGYDLSLQIVGRSDDDEYLDQIMDLQRKHSAWISINGGLPRAELLSLMNRHKYGINGALDEHFGIAVAELVKSGSIVFVPNGGGQTEIVGAPELIYDGVDDAVAKIIAVVSEENAQQIALEKMAQQGDIFSIEAFCNKMRRTVQDFLQPVAR